MQITIMSSVQTLNKQGTLQNVISKNCRIVEVTGGHTLYIRIPYSFLEYMSAVYILWCVFRESHGDAAELVTPVNMTFGRPLPV